MQAVGWEVASVYTGAREGAEGWVKAVEMMLVALGWVSCFPVFES